METGIYNHIIKSALAENTRIAYDKGWKRFYDFCKEKNYTPLPADPSHVVEFLINQATQPVNSGGKFLSMGTVVLYHSAINRKHVDAGLLSPTRAPEVANVLRGLKRLKGTAPRQVKALREYQIESMLAACLSAGKASGSTARGLRDAAIIAIGFAAALRRSEICNLKVDDIEFIDSIDGVSLPKMFLYIRKSKTDQQGKGQKIAIPEGKKIKPIMRLKDWLNISGIHSGHVFQTLKRGGGLKGKKLHHSDVPRIIKHYAEQIGLDPSEVAGHSLRAGFVTSAAAHHARLDKIMEVTRHRNSSMVLKYIREADSFTDHAGTAFL